MEGVPQLSVHDVRAELERLYKSRRRSHLFAFYGTGDDDMVALPQHAPVRIVPVRSELELREQLPDLGDEQARIAFLVPWTQDIPPDISGRFARNGRVLRIGKEARLRHLFGVREVSHAALSCPLAGYLLAPSSAKAGEDRRYAGGEGRLTEDGMWSAWLRQDWGVPTKGGLALDMLLGWAAIDRRGSTFAAAMDPAVAAGVSEALHKHLATKLGPAGPLVWSAWQSDAGAALLQLALLLETLASSEDAGVRMWIKTRVRPMLSADRRDVSDAQVLQLAQTLGLAAAAALRWVESQGGSGEARALARAADDSVQDEAVRAALAGSTRLPSAWVARLNVLGEALSAGAARPSPEALQQAVEAFRNKVEGHVFFQDTEQGNVLKRAEMAVRLLAWLVARPDKQRAGGLTPYGKAIALGRWYAEEGGYVDWARRWARSAVDSPFTAGISAVVRAADEVRSKMDRAFAKSLKAWVDATQPADQVLPIHEAVGRIAAKFLDGHEERRLLVLLLDGMAWAQAVELLQSLGHRAAPWGPLAWHATREGRVGEGYYPVVFASLPTVTEVSRSSFFAGKQLKPGDRLDTQKDPQRWADNPHAKRFCPENDVPQLLLRAESHTQGGNASQQALALVADPNRRMVAMVLNAIDDELKGSHAMRQVWHSESIASLPILLEKAREHGRSVLLCSDHGHILYRDKTKAIKAPHPGARSVRAKTTGIKTKSGARWRPWPTAQTPIGDNEIGIAGKRVCAPRGAEGVVLLMDDTGVYTSGAHAGEHGGASLAEVVAPCLLIGCEDGAPTLAPDPACAVRPAYVPSWWHFELSQPSVEEPPAKAAKAAAKAAKHANPGQLDLLARPEPQDRTEPQARTPITGQAASSASEPSTSPAGTAQTDTTQPNTAQPSGKQPNAQHPSGEPSGTPQLQATAAQMQLAEAFAQSEVFSASVRDAKERAVVVRAVRALLARGGVMAEAAFGREMEMLPFRVRGFVSKLQEVLNLDGYSVLRYDPVSRQVQLDKAKLEQLFEVSP